MSPKIEMREKFTRDPTASKYFVLPSTPYIDGIEKNNSQR